MAQCFTKAIIVNAVGQEAPPPPRRQRKREWCEFAVSVATFMSAWAMDSEEECAIILRAQPRGYHRVDDTAICRCEPAQGDCHNTECVVLGVPRRNRTTSCEKRPGGIVQAII